MEVSIWDLAVDELVERQRMARAELQQRFKKTKPFRMEPMSEKKALADYEKMTPERLNERLARDGQEATMEYLQQMNELKGRERYG